MGNVLLTLMMTSSQADADANGGPGREVQGREMEREGEEGQAGEEAGGGSGIDGINPKTFECSLLESLALELAVEVR